MLLRLNISAEAFQIARGEEIGNRGMHYATIRKLIVQTPYNMPVPCMPGGSNPAFLLPENSGDNGVINLPGV